MATERSNRQPGRKTVYDVARAAGVSISTVSLTINHPDRVNEATRQRVIRAATRLGYRGAASSGTGVRVAVAAPFSSYPSYFRRLTGMLESPTPTPVEFVVHDLPSTAARDAPVLDALPIRAGVDGIIVMGAPLARRAIETDSLPGPPAVLVDVSDSPQRQLDLPTVLIDDRVGGSLIGQHLASREHRTVAFVHEVQRSSDYLSAGMLRVDGLSRHVRVIDVPTNAHASLDQLANALGATPGITAVVANHDALAAEIHRKLAPTIAEQRLSLVGYDDGPLAEALGLTTVRQPFEESGSAALDLLLKQMAGEQASVSTIVLTPELIPRDTTAARAG